MKNKIAITTSSFAEYNPGPLTLLKESGFAVVNNAFGRKLGKKETLKLCRGCVGIVAGTETYDQDILGKLQGLKVISRCGVGMENVDIGAANRLGIKVYSTPEAPTLAVAELTVGLILALLRKILVMDREMRVKLWKKRMGSLLFGKQVGIVGFGRIGRKAAVLLKALGADIFYTDPYGAEKETGDFIKVGFEELLRKSDIISLHLPYSQQTDKLFGEKEFSLLKQGALLVNCSRGGIVDERVLHSALKDGKLAGAAIDVFEQEPYYGPLKELDNIVLTPHIGSYAKETRVEMEVQAVRNLLKGLELI